jgi:hypothetical protein
MPKVHKLRDHARNYHPYPISNRLRSLSENLEKFEMKENSKSLTMNNLTNKNQTTSITTNEVSNNIEESNQSNNKQQNESINSFLMNKQKDSNEAFCIKAIQGLPAFHQTSFQHTFTKIIPNKL